MKTRLRVLALCALSVACHAAGGSFARAGEPETRRPLLEAARNLPAADWQEPLDSGEGLRFSGDTGWFRSFWDKHKWHMLTTFVMVEADFWYAKEVGTSTDPLLFSEPSGLDSSVDASVYDENASLNFVENNKTNLLQAVALASIFGTRKGSWSDTADDFMGLIEAEKFNTASTELVKRVVGRRRPALDRADATEMTQAEYDDLQSSDAGHLSFYSAATSEAFTYCSYLDLVVARRLEGHRAWRYIAGAGFYGFAGYIGYTRLRQGEHYLTDVLAGAAAGTFVGRGFYKANHRDRTSDDPIEKESRIHFSPPMPVPGGGVVSMTIELGR